MNWLVILMCLVIIFIYINSRKENMGMIEQSNTCLQYGDDYDSCYANPQCTIWFRPNGSTYCTKKFIHENI